MANPSEGFDCVCELEPVDRSSLCPGAPDVEGLSEVVESFDLCRQIVPLGEGVAALGPVELGAERCGRGRSLAEEAGMRRAVVVEFMSGDGERLGRLSDADACSASADWSSDFDVAKRRSVAIGNGVDDLAESMNFVVDWRAALVDLDSSVFESLDRCPSLVRLDVRRQKLGSSDFELVFDSASVLVEPFRDRTPRPQRRLMRYCRS